MDSFTYEESIIPDNFVLIEEEYVTSPLITNVEMPDEDDDSDDEEEGIHQNALLDGRFFKLISEEDSPHSNNRRIRGECQLCYPNKTVISGMERSTSNFLRHLKRKHHRNVSEYIDYKEQKRSTRTYKRYAKTHRPLSFFTSGSRYLRGVSPNSSSQFSTVKTPTTSQQELDDKIMSFIIDGIHTYQIIEEPAFIDLFSFTGLNVISCDKLSNNISAQLESVEKKIMCRMKSVYFVCSTVDLWTVNAKNYFTVTAHWLNENLARESAMLSCTDVSNNFSYNLIMQVLDRVYAKYELYSSQIVGTIADNGINLVNMYKEFGLQDLQFLNHDVTGCKQDGTDDFCHHIPQYVSLSQLKDPLCSRRFESIFYSLNILAVTDYKNVVEQHKELKQLHSESMKKCAVLWSCSKRPETSLLVSEILNTDLLCPDHYSWYSFYDSILHILEFDDALPIVYKKIDAERLSTYELRYLRALVYVMKPVANALEKLQNAKDALLGEVLPILFAVESKLQELVLKSGHDLHTPLVVGILAAYKNRFNMYLQLQSDFHLIASASHPYFKLRWIPPSLLSTQHQRVEEMLVESCRKNFCSESSGDDFSNKDGFFVFHEVITVKTHVPEITSFTTEVKKYLEDSDHSMECLNKYPNVKKVFVKYNTPLSSSYPVNYLFGCTPDNNVTCCAAKGSCYEKLLMLRANHQFTKK